MHLDRRALLPLLGSLLLHACAPQHSPAELLALPACPGMEPYQTARLSDGRSLVEAFEALAAEVRADPQATPVLVPGSTPAGPPRPDDIVRTVTEHYPPELRDAGIGGTVRVAMLADAEGTVRLMQVVRTSGHPELDLAALRVVRTMRFRPLVAGGCRVPGFASGPVTFIPAR